MAKNTTRSKSDTAKKLGRAQSEPYQKALEGLEKSLKALYKGDPAKAKEQLTRLQKDYPGEKELMDRVQSYLVVCEQRLSPQKRPKNAEEMVTSGVISLNDGDHATAIKQLTKALELEPKSAHIQYCLAAAHALSGDAPSTAKLLKQAIGSDPSALVHARVDEDFSRVWDSEEVAVLLGEAS
jgi:tetratricopeptide (TPR) repeat protein